MTCPVEVRHRPAVGLQIRSTSTGVKVSGYASVFSQRYRVGAFDEVVAPGAFTRTLAANPDVRLLIDHVGQPLARTKSGTLSLSQDSRGLRCEADLDPTDPDVMRLIPKMRRGDLDQMSFAFRVPVDGDSWSDDYSLRTLLRCDLDGGDVSIVTYPASPITTVGLETLSRSFQQAARSRRPLVSLAEARRIQRILRRVQ